MAYLAVAALQKRNEGDWPAAGGHADLESDASVMLRRVKRDGMALQHAVETLREDRSIVLAAVKQNGAAVQFAAKHLKKDREIALAVVTQAVGAWRYLDESVLDGELVRRILPHDASVLAKAGELLKDPTFALFAMQTNGEGLRFCDDAIRANAEIALAAARSTELALWSIDKTLFRKPSFALQVARVHPRVLWHLPRSLLKDRGFLLDVVMTNAAAFRFFRSKLQLDAKFVLLALTVIPNPRMLFGLVSDSLKTNVGFLDNCVAAGVLCRNTKPMDREAALAAVAENGLALGYHAAMSFRGDDEVVLRAVRSNWRALAFVDAWHKTDRRILSEAALSLPDMEDESESCELTVKVLRPSGGVLEIPVTPDARTCELKKFLQKYRDMPNWSRQILFMEGESSPMHNMSVAFPCLPAILEIARTNGLRKRAPYLTLVCESRASRSGAHSLRAAPAHAPRA